MSNTTTTQITNTTLTAAEVIKATRTADHMRAVRLSSGVEVLDLGILQMLESSVPAEVRKGLELAVGHLKLTDSGRAYEARLAAAQATEEQQAKDSDLVLEPEVTSFEPASAREERDQPTYDEQLAQCEALFPTWEERSEFREWCIACGYKPEDGLSDAEKAIIASIAMDLAERERLLAEIKKMVWPERGQTAKSWFLENLTTDGRKRLMVYLRLKSQGNLDAFVDAALTKLHTAMVELALNMPDDAIYVKFGQPSKAAQTEQMAAKFFGKPEERAKLTEKICKIISEYNGRNLFAKVPEDATNLVELAKTIYRSDSDEEAAEEVKSFSIAKLRIIFHTLEEAARLVEADTVSLTPLRTKATAGTPKSKRKAQQRGRAEAENRRADPNRGRSYPKAGRDKFK